MIDNGPQKFEAVIQATTFMEKDEFRNAVKSVLPGFKFEDAYYTQQKRKVNDDLPENIVSPNGRDVKKEDWPRSPGPDVSRFNSLDTQAAPSAKEIALGLGLALAPSPAAPAKHEAPKKQYVCPDKGQTWTCEEPRIEPKAGSDDPAAAAAQFLQLVDELGGSAAVAEEARKLYEEMSRGASVFETEKHEETEEEHNRKRTQLLATLAAIFMGATFMGAMMDLCEHVDDVIQKAEHVYQKGNADEENVRNPEEPYYTKDYDIQNRHPNDDSNYNVLHAPESSVSSGWLTASAPKKHDDGEKPPVDDSCEDCGADIKHCTCKNFAHAADEMMSGLGDSLRRIVAGTAYEQPTAEAISQYGEDNALIGLYWYCVNYHGGQDSTEYSILSQLGDSYQPAGHANGPEPDSAEELAYEHFGGTVDDGSGGGDEAAPADQRNGPSDDPHANDASADDSAGPGGGAGSNTRAPNGDPTRAW
jgi:hypothetical protein